MKEILTKKYIAGTSTHQEEQELLSILKEISTPTAEEEALMDMLSMTCSEMAEDENWLNEDESELFDQLMKEEQSTGTTVKKELKQSTPVNSAPPRFTKTVAIRFLATAAVLTGVFLAAKPYLSNISQEETTTYFYGKEVKDNRIAMDMMEETMFDIFDHPDVESELADLLN